MRFPLFLCLSLLNALQITPSLLAQEGEPKTVTAEDTGPQPAGAEVNLLKLDTTIEFKGLENRSPVIEQLPDGGIKVTYTNSPEFKKQSNPKLTIEKTFPEPVSISVLTLEVLGAEDHVWIKVFNESRAMAFEQVKGMPEFRLDMSGMVNAKSEEPFTGKVAKLLISVPLEREPGEYSLTIRDLKIDG